ncbi:hypothetical protein BV898_00958 [Hypsibius exemplaris]|uniref:G-protein coupled receptors family 1 profile domain-containing protein n=1 Tax=Hypsibius exemplaris TaxID=2072580 RepID=A0A1W0XCR4_HYPEX|nr:hypothetical protein BV898_00958 [Hypsibius exemplaris]
MANNNTTRTDECGRVFAADDFPYPPEHPIRLVEGTLYPILLLLSTVGNILNILVLKRHRPKSTADIFMTTMAVSDLIIMWLNIPLWTKKISAIPSNPGFVSFDIIYRGVYIWLTTIFYFISDWIVIVFSTERLLVVVKPTMFLGRFNAKTANIAVLVIVLLGILKALEVPVDYFLWLQSGQPIAMWAAGRPKWLAVWVAIQAVVMISDPILSFTTFLVANVILCICLFRRHKARGRDLQTGQVQTQTNAYRATTILSLGCAVQFLLCKIPVLSYNSLLIASIPPFCSYVFHYKVRQIWLAVVWFFSSINYSINFYVYCAVSKKFRRQLKAQFPGMVRTFSCCNKSEAAGSVRSTATTTGKGGNFHRGSVGTERAAWTPSHSWARVNTATSPEKSGS